ncbi:MAG: hypothetical protein PHH54_06090 [Candidatus Nanoarchaeia archaeon]|nr:hypothetical protein [Candidatus Nanoarchaeia archaeon]MDD5741524.1 hypothetical protein [Candidatus Nanoarchaeia archaeon]
MKYDKTAKLIRGNRVIVEIPYEIEFYEKSNGNDNDRGYAKVNISLTDLKIRGNFLEESLREHIQNNGYNTEFKIKLIGRTRRDRKNGARQAVRGRANNLVSRLLSDGIISFK